MQLVSSYPDGVFCWVDLSSADVAAAKTFYTSLFGWQADDVEHEGETIYTMFHIDGNNVAGVGELNPEMKAQGIPSFWSSYVKHSDVDSVAAKAAKAGGALIAPPFDVTDSGRMAIVQDPTGAMVGIWQPKSHKGADLVNHNHSLVWNELQTRDIEKAKSFYTDVFGWSTETDENIGYITFFQDGRQHAGMLQMDENFDESVPPNWGVYFMVEDVDTTSAQATNLGANLLVPPVPAGDIGRFSVIQDPTGGVFSIIQFNGPTDPPPGY